MADRRFEPAGPLRGTLSAPPDKSISHRAAILAAMAEGSTRSGAISTPPTPARRSPRWRRSERGSPRSGADATGGIELTVDGVGLRGARGAEIDVGNAGTLLRLLPGWLAGQPDREWTLDGDESIRRRPVDRVVEPLRRMGARISARDGRLPPLAVRGAPLSGIEYRMPVASAQVKSCVLLAGLLADAPTRVTEGARRAITPSACSAPPVRG